MRLWRKGLLCAALCAALLFASPYFLMDGSIGAAGETVLPQAASQEQIILLPFRNASLESADKSDVILMELAHTLDILQYANVPLSVIPLHASTGEGPVLNALLPQDREQVHALFGSMPKGRTMNKENMGKAIGGALDDANRQVKAGVHTTVILLQAQAVDPSEQNHPQWQGLRSLLANEKVDLVLLGVESKAMPDLLGFAKGLGLAQPEPGIKPGQLTRLGERVRAALIPANDPGRAYGVMLDILSGVLPRVWAPLDKMAGSASITLPVSGVSHLMLALEAFPSEYALLVKNGSGQELAYHIIGTDSAGRMIVNVEGAAGELTVMAAKRAQESPPPSGTDAQPTPASNSLSPSPSPLVDTIPVDGFAVFDYSAAAALSLAVGSDSQVTYKKQPVTVFAKLDGEDLHTVLRTYRDIKLMLLIRDSAGSETVQPLAWADQKSALLTAEMVFEHAGDYTIKAQVQVGDFYRLESRELVLKVSNRPPQGSKTERLLWANDPYGQFSLQPLELGEIFSDADNDSLQYRISPDGSEGSFLDEMEIKDFGYLLARGTQLIIQPTVPSGRFSIVIQATDEDGYQAKAELHVTLRSMYEQLGHIRLQTPVVVSGNVGKRSTVTLSAGLTYQDGMQKGSPEVLAFLKHASVVLQLKDASGKPVKDASGGDVPPVPMAYSGQADAYMCTLELTNTAQEMDASAAYVLSFRDIDASYADLSFETGPVRLAFEGIAPEWIAAQEDLGKRELKDAGSGEETYAAELDFASLFRDRDDITSGDGQDVVYAVAVSGGTQPWGISPMGDGRFLVVRKASSSDDAPSPAPPGGNGGDAGLPLLDPQGVPLSKATLVFMEKGEYTITLTATDPDNKSAGGSLRLALASVREKRLILMAAAGLGLLILLVLITLLVRCGKPAFRQLTLDVAVSCPALQMQFTIRLDAWGKRKVPLSWVLINGGVPPEEAVYAIAGTTVLRPARGGVRIGCTARDDGWKRGRERLPRKFVQRAQERSITYESGNARLELAIRDTAGERPEERA